MSCLRHCGTGILQQYYIVGRKGKKEIFILNFLKHALSLHIIIGIW